MREGVKSGGERVNFGVFFFFCCVLSLRKRKFILSWKNDAG